jgi:hypothetical protein
MGSTGSPTSAPEDTVERRTDVDVEHLFDFQPL